MKGPITPCLWFNNRAEEAAKFYTSVFENSKIESTSYYPKEGSEVHHQKEGTAMTVVFEINGQKFTALNGGDQFKFSEAISLQVFCENQEEIDYYWNKLSEGGEEGPCGWLKDKFGLSWQIVPSMMGQLMSNPATSGKVMNAFMQMKKFDIATLKKAAEE
jgi:predicted 3-demethylubiquinone-9 3-methyltransferase (glyoxalase superfamily)